MFRIFFFVCLTVLATCFQFRSGKAPRVEPEFLDHLRREGRHEEFSYYIGANSVEEVIPDREDPDRPWSRTGVCEMDLTNENPEKSRQAVIFSKDPKLRWPKLDNKTFAAVPFTIEPGFNDIDQKDILSALLSSWNTNVPWIKWTNYAGERDYVYIYWSDRCAASLGRRGGQQGLQLTSGCVNDKGIMHEGMHAIGMLHEHQRHDRDKYISIIWENIYPDFRFAYRMTSEDYEDVGEYDYYTFMHYYKTAFTFFQNYSFSVLDENVHINDVGSSWKLTEKDIGKLKYLYDV